MAVVDLETFINGKIVKDVKEWQDIKLTAFFGDDSSQPQIESDRFTFVLDGAKTIIDEVAKGNIFEGLPAQMIYKERDNLLEVFNGRLDTSDGYEEINTSFGDVERPNEVKVKFKADASITSFLDKINGVTYGSLVEEGFITKNDFTTIKTVIVKKSSFLEVATMIVSIYLIKKQIQDAIKEIQKTIAEIASIVAGGLTGSIAAAIYIIALAIVQVAYVVALIILLVKLVKDLIDLIIPPVVKNKGIKLRTLLSKACERYGFNLVSPIEELDTYHYLPSKPYSNEKNILKDIIPQNVPTTIGTPNTTDYGYLINESFELAKRLFNARLDIIGNDVHLRNADDNFWLKQSTFVPHKTINFSSKKYNTEELFQTRLMSFVVDPNDEWTTENYTGTSYEVKTESTVNNTKSSIKGLDRIDIPLALPSNKDKLNVLEKLVIELASFADELARIFGQKQSLASTIRNNRTGVLKISQNDYSVAKLVPLKGNQIPSNHRDLLSAKTLINKYYFGKSFVLGKKLGQKVIYENIVLPFTLSDFQKTIKNGTFILPDGRKAKFRELDWQFSKDLAEATIEVQEIYTTKLKETYYEP